MAHAPRIPPPRLLNPTPEDVRAVVQGIGPARDLSTIRRAGGDGPRAGGDDFLVSENGLWLPREGLARVDPLKNVKVYLTTVEIFGTSEVLSLDRIVDLVSDVSVEVAIAWCASWTAQLQHPGRTQLDVDREFVSLYLQEPYRTRVLNLLRYGNRVLLSSQSLMVLMKVALEHCGRGGPPQDDVDIAPLILGLLGVPSHLASDVEAVAEDELVVDVDGGRMGVYLVANQLFNNPGDWRTAWAVFHRCVRETPAGLSGDPRILPFASAYRDATGVELDDLVTLSAVLWARATSPDGPTLPLAYLDPLKWAPERLSKVMDLISTSPETLQGHLRRDESELGWRWSTRTFDQFPVVRWGDQLTVLNPSWLVNRATGFWPLFDVRRSLEPLGGDSLASRVAGSIEHCYEHFALEVIESLTGVQRVYRDSALRRAYGKNRPVADAAIDYGDSWVVVEVSTKRPQLKTAAGVSQKALGQDLDHLVRKATQVQASIKNLRVDEKSLTGRQRTVRHRKFYPVVVLTSRFPGNPITYTMLRARLRDACVLAAEDCAPLEVLDIEDLLALQGACEHRGYSLLELLAEKAKIERPLVPMKEFLATKLGQNAPYSSFVEESWSEWMNTAIEQLRAAGA